MRRCVLQKSSLFDGLDKSLVYIEPVCDYVEENNDLQAVLNEIFSVDPVSGFPKGDIQYFLSKDGNPQVKAWLESNLLTPRSKMTGSSIEGVTDDLIVEMSRKSGETSSAYSARLQSILNEAKANVNLPINE